MEDLLATTNYLPLTTIIVKEVEGIERINEPVTVGIPVPKGFLYKTSKLVLHDTMFACIPLQSQVLARWPDKSLKWVLLDFQISLEASQSKELELIMDDSGTVSDKELYISIEENPNYFFIDTKAASFFVNTSVFKPFDRVIVAGKEVLDIQKSRIVLIDESNNKYEPIINYIFFETKGALRATLRIEGTFKRPDKSVFAGFVSRLSFFAHSQMIKLEFTIVNPNAAKHPGGIWDLGDPGSIFFKDLSIYATLNAKEDSEVIWITQALSEEQDKPHITKDNLLIYQDSSGGENWQSKNHLNRDGELSTSFRGYRVYNQDEEIIEQGTRANPVLSITDGNKKISAGIQHFWQNFPKALEYNHHTLLIKLFPKQSKDLFELQGGEQKTHTLFLDFDEEFQSFENLKGLVQNPLTAYAHPEWYAKTKALSYFVPDKEDPNQALSELIHTAIKGDYTFFDRREIIDEYGWRNFGEIYADHEAVGHTGTDPLISHYNNQYDCIYGTLIQFLRTGNFKWFLLGDQLCNHVRDIDIYHTDQDRPEFNRGLFWHTDHYIDVQTATHRCFSKHHATDRDMNTYGGGPSLSHNYSTGLLLHYYITGAYSSLETALDLGKFVINNMGVEDAILGHILKKMRGTRSYFKNIFGKKELVELTKVYGLDGPGRASGNSLNALMNAYLLSRDEMYLNKADRLISCCVHPDDDIDRRDLLDTENRWMYTVFLQALGRYLDIKTDMEQLDSPWEYARQCLIHYAKWMAKHEYPYLKKPEKLEYPNETWAAQEIRKSNIFLYAVKYAGQKELKQNFLNKAAFFYKEAMTFLFQFDTRILTRPIALVMLNGMMYSHAKNNGIASINVEHRVPVGDLKNKKKPSNPFSLEREIQFLKWRL